MYSVCLYWCVEDYILGVLCQIVNFIHNIHYCTTQFIFLFQINLIFAQYSAYPLHAVGCICYAFISCLHRLGLWKSTILSGALETIQDVCVACTW